MNKDATYPYQIYGASRWERIEEFNEDPKVVQTKNILGIKFELLKGNYLRITCNEGSKISDLPILLYIFDRIIYRYDIDFQLSVYYFHSIIGWHWVRDSIVEISENKL